MSQNDDLGLEREPISLSSVYRQLDDHHLGSDEAQYDVGAGLERLVSWMNQERPPSPVGSPVKRPVAQKKVATLFIDDLDGSEAEGTVRFELDGAEYEIDLNAEHAQALRKALARYIQKARRADGRTRRPDRGGRRPPADGLNTTEVREWAKAQGIEVKDRGQEPAELVIEFKAATER
jgi:Lsr2